ncbi:alpha/beta hydrolase family protein [Pseudomonas sp. CGJS7]|uniref:alpha/beta hydrolase family protein n=1 Tax=Pseudomonas sp. CGJS7 TaxID=3109348 RepID=UPI0030097D0F
MFRAVRKSASAITRIAAAALVLLALSLAIVPAASAAGTPPKRFDLPPTTGPYRVGTFTLHLVDRSRIDGFVGGPREFMVTVSYPIAPNARGARAPWLEPALVPEWRATTENQYNFAPGAVDWASARRPAIQNAPMLRHPHGWPVVLFSPGLQYFRELYSAGTDDLASHGYVVASMTHTYEAFYAAFPGGRVARGVELTETVESTQMWLDTRVADSRHLLDALTLINRGFNPDAELRRLPAGLRGALDLSRVGYYGHSYGGTTAGETMFFDRRFDAGLNFDGRMSTTFGPPQDLPYGPTRAARFGLDRPFALIGAEGHTHLNPFDPSWPEFWRNQRGWKRDVHVPLGVHFTFSDFAAILPPLGDAVPPGFAAGAYGTLPAAEAVAGSRAYVRAFFDRHLKGRPTRLFDTGSPAYPNFQPVP